jgi:uncharacterized protein YecT (DUF1311 family)
MKKQKFIVLMIILLSIFTLVACNNKSEENINDEGESSQRHKEEVVKENIQETERATSLDENITEDNSIDSVAKIKGRQEFLEKLDDIQKELDSLDIKKDSDNGVTNAMRSFYGISYDEYDKALNEIYDLFKEKLPKETMKELQEEQLKWIKEKEERAMKESEEYKDGTFEFVAYNISLYESTKDRCYELVNTYMED